MRLGVLGDAVEGLGDTEGDILKVVALGDCPGLLCAGDTCNDTSSPAAHNATRQ